MQQGEGDPLWRLGFGVQGWTSRVACSLTQFRPIPGHALPAANSPDPPYVGSLSYKIQEDTTLSADATRGLLSNTRDFDPGDVVHVAAIARPPARGRLLSWNAVTGAFVYVPNADASGLDYFSFVVSDSWNLTTTANAAIKIRKRRKPPWRPQLLRTPAAGGLSPKGSGPAMHA